MFEASAGFILTPAAQKKQVVRGFEVKTPDELRVAQVSKTRLCSCASVTDAHRYILWLSSKDLISYVFIPIVTLKWVLVIVTKTLSSNFLHFSESCWGELLLLYTVVF